jgi:hypothetical protein
MNAPQRVSTQFRRPVVDNYAPQWSYSATPPGFLDQFWCYGYTFPVFEGANYPLGNFPMPLDADADFFLRGLAFSGGDGTPASSSAFLLVLRDPYGNQMADDYQPLVALAQPGSFAYGFENSSSGLCSLGLPALVKPEIRCPAGSGLSADLIVEPGTPPGSGIATFYLLGVKRYRSCK